MKSFLLLSKLGFLGLGLGEISYRYNQTATSVEQASLDNTNDLKSIFDEKHQNSILDKKPNILLILADDVGTGQWYLVLAFPIINNSSSNMNMVVDILLSSYKFFYFVIGDVPGYWSNNIVNMENLSSLQEKGVTFMDAHSTPLCAPSRYMLLSGNYSHR